MRSLLAVPALTLTLGLLCGCFGDGSPADRDTSFSTSGSREADQRAEQRIAKERELRGGEDDEDAPKAKPTLYVRLGSEDGIARIVADFVDRVIADPRTNWERKGIKRGAVLGIGGSSVDWKPTPQHLERLKKHLAQFIAVATGGPAEYDGKGIGAVHEGMKITNAEFDAAIGALKASLDALAIGIGEQKELLALFESTRPQVAEKR